MIDYRLIAWSLEWEGTIAVSKIKTKNNIFSYATRICIGNTDKELLEEFKNTIKIGHVTNEVIRRGEWSNIYTWTLNVKERVLHIPLILPHLISKWRQAELVIEANKILKTIDYINKLTKQQRNMSEIYSYKELLTLEAIFQECKELNDRLLKIKKRKLL